MTIEEFIIDYKDKVIKEFEETKAKGRNIATKKSASIDEMLDNAYEMGASIGKIDFLNDLTKFILKNNFEKMEVKRND